VVPPSPDPLAGIERRAARMQRNRLAASVAGSVLAVAAIATAVPLLSGTTSPAPDAPPVASAQPSPRPTTVVTTPSYALDPQRPWAYRGTPLAELGNGTVDTITREYATRRGVTESAVALTPLWGRVYEPSQQAELVFVATVDGEDRWGYASGGDAGPEFVVDEALPSPALALAAALPGDEGARLVVVASPEAGELQYGPDDASEYATMEPLADGVGITALDGDPATATYRVLDPAGTELLRRPVPPVSGPEQPPGTELPTPSNVVDWPPRGAVPDELRAQADADFARAAGVPVEQVRTRLLYGGERDGTTFALLQGWYGSDARAFAWASRPDGSTASALLGFTAPGPALFAAVLDGVLLVVPEPRAGQVLYAPDATGEPQPVPDQGTEVAVLVDRPDDRVGDRLLVLDGDGDPEQPIFRGTVEEALASSR
jgi:hypothetical protein